MALVACEEVESDDDEDDDVPRSWVVVAEIEATERSESEPFELTGGQTRVTYSVSGERRPEGEGRRIVDIALHEVAIGEGLTDRESIDVDSPHEGTLEVGEKQGQYRIIIRPWDQYWSDITVTVVVEELREDHS